MIKKASKFLVLILLLSSFNSAFSQQSIVVDTVIQTSPCAGSMVVIQFSLPGGDYDFGNVFTAQMSSEPDFFTHFPCPLADFDVPLEIGVLPFWTGPTMFGQIPDSLTLSTYSIRIISSSPPDTSSISPNCVLITNLPAAIFKIAADPSQDTICQGDSVELSVLPLPLSYEWSTGETTETIWVRSSGSYTVKVRDTLGCETESDPYTVEFETCIGIEDKNAQFIDLAVQPVPASDMVQLIFTTKEAGPAEVYVYNLLGEEVLIQKFETGFGVNRYLMDISTLNKGLYLVKVGKDNAFGVVKMIKQ